MRFHLPTPGANRKINQSQAAVALCIASWDPRLRSTDLKGYNFRYCRCCKVPYSASPIQIVGEISDSEALQFYNSND